MARTSLTASLLVLALSIASAGQKQQAPVGLPKAQAVAAPAAALQGPAQAAAVAAVQARVEAAAPALDKLAGAQAASVGAEEASGLAAALIDPTLSVRPGSDADPVAAPAPAPQPSGLAPASPAPSNTVRPVVGPLDKPESLGQRVDDRSRYTRLWVQHLWFYLVTNIVNKWPPYLRDWKALKASGVEPPVSSPRRFFAHMRVMGQTGEFYILGYVARDDQAVVDESMETFDKFFNGAGIGPRERDSFAAFLDRARNYNTEKRAISYFRKIVRDSMLKASTMKPETLAPYFDSLYAQDVAAKAADFQGGKAAEILGQFREIILDEMRREPAGANGRVLGALLIGSFASGAATPSSDFDVELVTEGGAGTRVHDFSVRVAKRWEKETGRHKSNPVTIHEAPLSPSRRLIRMVHDAPYLVLSPDADLTDKLSMKEGEPFAFAPRRDLTVKGLFERWFQYGAVYLTSLLSPKAK